MFGTELWHVPPRLAAAAIILNSGVDKQAADEETATRLHGMASAAYPPLANQDPQSFVATLSKAELALGIALALPFVPSGLAGAALTAFSGGLLGLYARVPGMRREGSVRPSQQGLAVAKDVWLLGIGLGLVTESLRRTAPED